MQACSLNMYVSLLTALQSLSAPIHPPNLNFILSQANEGKGGTYSFEYTLDNTPTLPILSLRSQGKKKHNTAYL